MIVMIKVKEVDSLISMFSEISGVQFLLEYFYFGSFLSCIFFYALYLSLIYLSVLM